MTGGNKLASASTFLFRLLKITLPVLFLAALTVCNARLYTPVPPQNSIAPEIIPHLRYQRHALENGSARNMQALFPEGYFFSYALYGLTWVDVGLQSPPDSSLRQEALTEARWAMTHLKSDAGKSGFPQTLDPPYGMFYAGWRNYLLTGILLLQTPGQQNQAELNEFAVQSEIIATAVAHSPTPFIPSYSGAAWPVDTFPAMVSLHGYTQLIDGRYEPLIAGWLADVQTLLDEETELVPHRTDYQTGDLLDGARGTSQVLILRFLAELDPELAHTHYLTFREQYLVTRFGLPGVLEFPPFRPGAGDVDSGPLLADVSLSATAVFLGTSRLFHDDDVMTAVWQGGEALGLAVKTGKGRRYAFGLLPIGDAFVVWSKAATGWFTSIDPPAYPPIIPHWWRWPFHSLSLAVLLVLYFGYRKKYTVGNFKDNS
ncbi:MAG: hypothetical protein GY805_10690 [Chloroflexi bacterium]|nr:hypothetical protein [Chloroflexota bacterium]